MRDDVDHSAARATAAAPEPGQLHVVLVLAASTGGIGAHVRSLAHGLVAHGVTVTVCAPAGTDALFGFSRTGARFHTVDITPTAGARSDATAIGELRRAFTGADVVHAHGLRAGLLSDLALRTAGRFPGLRPETPLVVTSHHALLATGMERRLQRLMERRVARAADLVLGASSDLVARARELGATDARLGPVAAPPMPEGRLGRAEARAALLGDGDGPDRPLVLAIGRLVPQKAFGLLLDAARELSALDPEPLVLLAGDGPEAGPLRERAAAEKLPVRLLGYRTDVPDLLAAADVVVVSSRWEARSLVVQEAMRAGVPVVATAVGGIPELVGDAAVLVPAGDPAAIGEAVRALLADPARREQLVAAGRQQAETWPDEAATVAQVLSTYDELVQRA
ncbi:glycosyltransferase involved in cell wall biosynthesis [Streptomyces sp. 1114.5]|uniref:glycosyltransferase family 4 protein n=1 Tax=Streptomyces sp. 1331.2 TaxID=1938835 RepID=UPI000BCD17F1|nr:glycosyltransferase family 4 protein [Streptomyces sp. 1331.2]RKT11255.1 glycosyltransferase involved in cell wall biosynthesis [Streptomyces sp. 1114.5]SOB81415.1 Glycosyltransferase involved in cell wall bisynthesis [Streptomyces sp. 1331.2]